MSLSNEIDFVINNAIQTYDGEYELGNPFEGILSMGELVDRLSIVNFKLYTLKNKVMQSDDKDFRAWASEEDVRLVEERARLKRCIDEKLLAMIAGSEFNAESKLYA
jgi:hypothetical protein